MKWEPQAPQMPHRNNLDLAVFPGMSKRHSTLLSNTLNRVANSDEVRNAPQQVHKNILNHLVKYPYFLCIYYYFW